MMNNKILIVENEPETARLIRNSLEAAGYEVETAVDAYQGTQLALSGSFILIILGLLMPAGGGCALLERIRKVQDLSSLPVIVITATAVDENIVETIVRFGVAAVFHKPLNTIDLLNKVFELSPMMCVRRPASM